MTNIQPHRFMINMEVMEIISRIRKQSRKDPVGAGVALSYNDLVCLADTVESLDKNVKLLCLDFAETEGYVEKVALRYLSKDQVEGDNYGVPGTEGIVDMLVALIPDEKKIDSSVKEQAK